VEGPLAKLEKDIEKMKKCPNAVSNHFYLYGKVPVGYSSAGAGPQYCESYTYLYSKTFNRRQVFNTRKNTKQSYFITHFLDVQCLTDL